MVKTFPEELVNLEILIVSKNTYSKHELSLSYLAKFLHIFLAAVVTILHSNRAVQ